MNDQLRSELYRQVREAQDIAAAREVNEALIRSNTSLALDPDDMQPLGTIVAAMLGLMARCEYTNHGWASKYGQHVRDANARNLLALLVKRTNLLSNELGPGTTDLNPTAVVRVDKVLAFAKSRGWDVSSLPGADHAAESDGPVQAVTRDEARRSDILAMLKKLGFDPRALPKNTPGKSGVRQQVRDALGKKGIWAGTKVFDKAWQGMRDDGLIADAP